MHKWGFPVIPLICWVLSSSAASTDNSGSQANTETERGAGSIPLSIQAAIELGLKTNPELKSSSSKIQAAKGRFWNGISPSSPEISGSLDNIPAGQNLSGFGENVLGVSQSIDFPTNYFLRSSKYRKQIEVSKQEYSQVRLDIVSKIKSAYCNVLALQNQEMIAQENLQIADQFLKKAEIRYSIGEGTNIEKLTASVQYTEALNNLKTQKNHLATALTELNYAMGNGKPSNQEYALTDSLMNESLNLNLDDILSQAVVNNPALTIGKMQVGIASVEQSLALSGLLPEFGVGAYSKKVVDDKKQRYYGVSFSATIPLWFMLDQNGRIKEASATVASAKADLQNTENSIRLQIKSAFNEYKDAERQVAAYHNEILPQAEEVYRSASKSYESGDITYLEFLEAQKTLIDARSNYTEALLDYNLSIITLEQVTAKTIK